MFPFLLEELNMIKAQIQANCFLEIEKIFEQLNKSFKVIDNFILNFEKNLDTESFSETELLKQLNEIKTLEYCNFEGSELENKYFYKILEEKDGTYKGIIGLGHDSIFIKQGKGNKAYKDGKLFEGEWKNNKREGKGSLKYENGNVYEGEWKNDKREGKGILKLANGNVYEGEWKNDKREGKGINKWIDGRVYEGEWKNDKREGKGIHKFPNGSTQKGQWKNDTLIQSII